VSDRSNQTECDTLRDSIVITEHVILIVEWILTPPLSAR